MDSMQVTNMFALEQCLRTLLENLGFLLANFELKNMNNSWTKFTSLVIEH